MNRSAATFFVALSLLFTEVAFAQQVEVLWLGHATTRLTSIQGKVIVIDPFLEKNPTTPAQYKELKALGHVDLILITHGHADHVGDLVELAKLTGATVVGNYEYVNQLSKLGLLAPETSIPMNKGGTVTPLGRGIKIHMVPAEHSSSVDLRAMALPESGALRKEMRYLAGGVPVGYVVEFENGFTVYHSGDTGVFGDMALIGKFYPLDLALVCIGGHFTMDPEGAAYAVRELLRPKRVLPIHYGTYPVINRTPAEFKAALGASQIEVLDLKPGHALRF